MHCNVPCGASKPFGLPFIRFAHSKPDEYPEPFAGQLPDMLLFLHCGCDTRPPLKFWWPNEAAWRLSAKGRGCTRVFYMTTGVSRLARRVLLCSLILGRAGTTFETISLILAEAALETVPREISGHA